MFDSKELKTWFKDITAEQQAELVLFALRELGESSANQASLRKRFPDVSFTDAEVASECWKDVEEYHGYKVSSLGRVKKLAPDGTEKILKQSVLTSGHRQVSPACNEGNVAEYVHRLVAHAFLEKCGAERPIVDHRDDNPANNRATNLQWATNSFNLSKEGKDKRRIATTNAKRESRPDSYSTFIKNYLDSQSGDGT